MSTTFTLGLAIVPGKLILGMDELSSSICGVLSKDLGYPNFVHAGTGSAAWTSKSSGVIASIRYAKDNLVQAFEELSGVQARLFVSLRPSKELEFNTMRINIFATAKQVLRRTECDAAFIQDWERLIFRRIHGQLTLAAKSDPRHETYSDEMLRQLDTSVDAQLLTGAAT